MADGRHARVDALVSAGAVVGIAGSAAGYRAADPVAGLVIVAVIVRILVETSREVLSRVVDAVDPAGEQTEAHAATAHHFGSRTDGDRRDGT